jgi:hypothetical protein
MQTVHILQLDSAGTDFWGGRIFVKTTLIYFQITWSGSNTVTPPYQWRRQYSWYKHKVAANGARLCFFCPKKNPPEQNDETFLYLFFNCPNVRAWQQQFFMRCFPELGILDADTEKKLFMIGLHEENFSPFTNSAFLTWQFAIWENKIRKNVPSFHTLYTEFLSLFVDTCRQNTDVKRSGTEHNFELCRIIFGRCRGLCHE